MSVHKLTFNCDSEGSVLHTEMEMEDRTLGITIERKFENRHLGIEINLRTHNCFKSEYRDIGHNI